MILSSGAQSCKSVGVLFVVEAIARSYSLSVAAPDLVEQRSQLQGAAQSGSRVTWIYVARLLSVVCLATILFLDFAEPGLLYLSDYVNSFYVAGHLAAAGEFDRLYPGPDIVSFRDSPFNDAAHDLLPRLPEGTTSNFMYPPIVAWVFAPLSVLPPNVSLLVWQVMSVGALGLACFLLSRASEVRARDLFFLSVLFFPILITVLIGQAGIIFGLLPLSIGYWLASRGSPLAAGFAWAALALKPQFLPAAGLATMAYAVTGRMRLVAGMLMGLCVWLALNYFLVPEGVLGAWIRSLRLSDAIFSSGDYQVPRHLVASIPADLMMRFSPAVRVSLKPLLYGLSGGLGLLALWQCRKILRSGLPEEMGRLAVFTTSLLILPLTSPHLLYYDLVTLFPIGLILLDTRWSRAPFEGLRRMVYLAWGSISAYLVFIIFYFSLSSLILLVILFAVWTLFLQKAVALSTMARWPAADRS